MEILFDTKAYAVKLKDKNAIKKSSSGGAFVALATKVIDEGGAVVSTIYNYDYHVNEFTLITDQEDIFKSQGSKYMQAYPNEIYHRAWEWIKEHPRKMLLFVGMGCQADGFRKFCEQKNVREQVLIVDIICHGVPSPKVWKDYINNQVYDYVNFRDKKDGWDRSRALVSYHGKKKLIRDFMGVYGTLCPIRPSCYECAYSTTERKSDITIGDYWGINQVMPDFYSSDGVSLLLIHSLKGQMLFEKIKETVEWRESNVEDCLQPNLVRPTERPANRDEFWRDYNTNNISYILKKYVGVTAMTKLKSKVKILIEQIFGGGY